MCLERGCGAYPRFIQAWLHEGVLRAIVIRPGHGQRGDLQTCEISLAGGTHGDHWARGCWKTTEAGRPHPDVQICLMNAR